MAIKLGTNEASLVAQKNLSTRSAALKTSFARLSSGVRLNSAADDAAGLAISDKLRSQLRASVVAERNANDGISMVQTADAALSEISSQLGRMRELAVQSANGSMASSERQYLDTEFQAIREEVSRVQTTTTFNGTPLINPDKPSSVAFQVGPGNSSSDQQRVQLGALDIRSALSSGFGIGGDPSSSLAAMSTIDQAMSNVSEYRSQFGASMNRFELTVANLQTQRINLASSESRIRDTDIAGEAAQLARDQVLAQGGVSVLAQANSSVQSAMGLLR